MTTYAQSNLFRVADPQTFTRFCRDFGVQFRTLTRASDPGVTFYSMSAPDGWPSYYLDPETGEEFEFNETLAQQLEEDAAVLFEISHEDGKHLAANAVAIAPGFPPVCLDITDIHLKAGDVFGHGITIREGF